MHHLKDIQGHFSFLPHYEPCPNTSWLWVFLLHKKTKELDICLTAVTARGLYASQPGTCRTQVERGSWVSMMGPAGGVTGIFYVSRPSFQCWVWLVTPLCVQWISKLRGPLLYEVTMTLSFFHEVLGVSGHPCAHPLIRLITVESNMESMLGPALWIISLRMFRRMHMVFGLH